MKKIAFFFAAIAALYMIVSCQKETKGQNDEVQARMSFVATVPDYVPESKTTFGDYDADHRKMPMLWSATDKIDVYGVTGSTTAKAVFEITSISGDRKSATFSIKEGETLGTFDEYYAIYPSGVALKQSSLSGSLEINSALSALENGQAIVENGYDPSLAIMTASVSAGTLAFRHGACYFGIQIPDDNITQIKIDVANTAFQKRPVYNSSTGAITANNSGSKVIKSLTGSFVKGSYYYLCAIPKKDNDTKMGNLTVTYTHNGVEKSVTTTATTISNAYPQIGNVYDLGCPPLPVPIINATAPSKLNDDATDGSFTYTVSNPDGVSSVSAAIKSGDWISNVAASAGTVTFDCTANTGEERTAVITLSYTGAADVDVTIRQKAAGSGSDEDYVWTFSSEGWQSAMNSQAASAKDTKASGWTVSYDGLSYHAGDDDRWSVDGYIQPNGSGYYKAASKRRYFLFTTTGGGYVYVTVRSNSSSEKTADVCAQLGEKNSADFTESVTSSSSEDTKVELGPFAAGGNVAVFLGGGGHRIYKVEFHTNKQ